MIANRTFFGKVLLFGEYSIVEGSDAAIVPFTKVESRLRFGDVLIPGFTNSNLNLVKFTEYLKKHKEIPVDTDIMFKELENGLFLESTIPAKYGLGSSGAVCAAVFDRFGEEELRNSDSLDELRTKLSLMEAYFHTKSSGLDPLCIYTGMPLVIRNKRYSTPPLHLIKSKHNLGIYLLDTGKQSHTASMMAIFREQLSDASYSRDFQREYIPLVNQAVEQWQSGTLKENTMAMLSLKQLRFFKPMIPLYIIKVWEEGLKNGLFFCKLCGSGGGGMVLLFARSQTETAGLLQSSFNLKMESLFE